MATTATPDDIAMIEGPCEWPVSYSSCSDLGPLSSWETDPEVGSDKARFESMAAEFLWRWTGRVFGYCTTTVRPCWMPRSRPGTFEGRGPYTSLPGAWEPLFVAPLAPGLVGLSYSGCGASCDAGEDVRSLALPGPVASVVEVRVGGVVVDPGAYRVDNRRILTRTDGGSWPLTQDLYADTDAEDTFEVTYKRGLQVPDGGQIAAGVLTVELAMAACGDDNCSLPQRLQSITRQGITMTVLDSFEDLKEGRTGIWLIDTWVNSVSQPKVGGRVFSPDVPRKSRETTWRS